MAACLECGAPIETWGSVQLCDRCLCARLWKELEQDDWLMIRRQGESIWVKSNIGGTRKGTNVTALGIDTRKLFEERLVEFESA